MNPIEHLWKKLKDAIYQRVDIAFNLVKLLKLSKKNGVPLQQIESLVAEALYKSRFLLYFFSTFSHGMEMNCCNEYKTRKSFNYFSSKFALRGELKERKKSRF